MCIVRDRAWSVSHIWVIARGTWWSNTRIPTLNKKPTAGAIYKHGSAVIHRQAKYSLRINILAYPPAFKAPVRGVPVRIFPGAVLGKTFRRAWPPKFSLTSPSPYPFPFPSPCPPKLSLPSLSPLRLPCLPLSPSLPFPFSSSLPSPLCPPFLPSP